MLLCLGAVDKYLKFFSFALWEERGVEASESINKT